MWFTAFTTAGVAAYAASTLLPVRGLHDWIVGGAVFHAPAGTIALTFDDGPDPERTPAVLDLLAGAGAKATFFLLGEKAARYPDIVRRIAEDGHEIGNHSWSHPWMPGLSGGAIEAQLMRCQEVLAGITGRAPRMVRPPYGSRDFRFYRIARRLGLTPALWSVDSRDWAGAREDIVLKRARRAKGGDILLFHDGNPRAVGAIPALERWLAEPPGDARLLALRPPGAASPDGAP